MDPVELMGAEIGERVALLRRYRAMLELQRERLGSYVQLLDLRDRALEDENFEALELYVLEEQHIIKGILDVKACLEPLSVMYARAFPEGMADIDELRTHLDRLGAKALEKNKASCNALSLHMEQIRTQIKSLRFSRGSNNVYGSVAQPALFDFSS